MVVRICLPPWCAIANANDDGRILEMKGAVRCGAIVGNASLMSFSRGGERAVDEEDGALSLSRRPEEMQR